MHLFRCILDKSITTRLPFRWTSLVEQEVKLGDFAVLGEQLQECVSIRKQNAKYISNCSTRNISNTHSSTVGCRLPT